MKLRLTLLLAVVLLPACDIDFLAVEVAEDGYIVLRSEQDSAVEASLEVALPGSVAPAVSLDGKELTGQHEGGRWHYRTTPAVDTLQPRLDLEIGGRDLLVPLPFATRNGSAIRRQTGDLELPIAYGGDSSDPHLAWRVVLVDSTGRSLIWIDSRAAPLPGPIVVASELVPAGAVAAEIVITRSAQHAEAAYPLNVLISSTLRVAVPGDL